MIYLVWITAIGLLVSIFLQLSKISFGRASKIRFWDLEKLRLELRKLKHKLIDAGYISFFSKIRFWTNI